MEKDVLRDQLAALLDGGNAHKSALDAMSGIPSDVINARPPSIPYSLWELVEHMRLAQRDIYAFITDPDYTEPSWPDDYWPPKDKVARPYDWDQAVDGFREDLEALKAIVQDTTTDLTEPLEHGPQYSILREILLVADHNAYHTGQIITLRRALGVY